MFSRCHLHRDIVVVIDLFIDRSVDRSIDQSAEQKVAFLFQGWYQLGPENMDFQ